MSMASTRGESMATVHAALSCGEDIVPLVGACTPDRLAEALAAAKIALTGDRLARMDAAKPHKGVAGYPATLDVLLAGLRSGVI